MTAKRLCKNCKHLETDGMFGIFCGVGGDNTKYDCPKYEGISTMTTKRFMVDDAGTLIDMHTRDTFDYVSDVCDLLNEQHETIQSLISDSEKYRKLSMQFDNRNKELVSENALLEKENEQLKIALKDKENLISICEKKFKELGYLIFVLSEWSVKE